MDEARANRRAQQIRKQAALRLQAIAALKAEVTHLEVEYEELTGESLLTPDRKSVVTRS